MIFHINLNSNLLKSLPNGIFQLTNLKFLDISNNKIGSEGNGYLSEAIANASALVELRASSNMIVQLPESIGELKNLEVLDLRDNRIEVLP
jgi:Leucine-rich repeat (LRR) protein